MAINQITLIWLTFFFVFGLDPIVISNPAAKRRRRRRFYLCWVIPDLATKNKK
jgi:hypothetical protein